MKYLCIRSTNNEKFGIKYYPHNVVMDGSNIVITSGNGKPVNITFADTPIIIQRLENLYL